MTMLARMRLCLTAERDELVAENDPRAAFLYAAIGDEIPAEAAARFGLVDGLLPGMPDQAAIAAAAAAAEEAAAKAAADAEAKREADAAEAAKSEADAAAKAEADAAAKAEADAAAKAEADAAAKAEAPADLDRGPARKPRARKDA